MNLLHANDRRGEYPRSWYADTCTPLPPFPELQGEIRADICVIGGGYTGLSAALHLARAGREVVLLEAHRVGFGASGRNGGQVGSGQRLDTDEMERLAGRDAAHALWDIAEDARKLAITLAAETGTPFSPGIVRCAHSRRDLAEGAAEAERLARDYGYALIEPLDRAALRAFVPADGYLGGEIDRGGGHLHPLNLALGVARLAADAGARIFEGSEVQLIRHGATAGAPTILQTGRGRVRCTHLVLAANGYLDRLEPRLASRIMPINNYIIATAPLGARADAVLRGGVAAHDTRHVVNYWRLSPDRRLIFGGGESLGYRFPRDIAAMVRRPMLRLYPQLADVAITHAWGGTLAITRSRLPCFRRLAPNCLSASGFSGHGVAMALQAGRILADAVGGEAKGFDTMAAAPTPRFPGGVLLRWPLLVAAMSWFSLRDRLGL